MFDSQSFGILGLFHHSLNCFTVRFALMTYTTIHMDCATEIEAPNGGEIRSAGCPCPHYHLSCISRHRLSSISTASNSSIVPTPASHAWHHCRDPQSRKSCSAALALFRASENDIGEDDNGDVIALGVPFGTSPASPPHSAQSSGGDAGGRCCCCRCLVPASRAMLATRCSPRHQVHCQS